GLNRLYFLYEAYDDYWDFKRPGLTNDIFEVVVDGDLSGGPFIKTENENLNLLPKSDLHFKGHGTHAQNYHVFTPAHKKDWAMIWGNAPWIKDFPHANAAYDYSFKHGESGTLRLEFYITVYDHADPRGPALSTQSQFEENDLIGLSWCILEYDNEEDRFHSFMNLAHDTEMIRNASRLCAFRLAPLEARFRAPLEANWSFSNLQNDKRLIAFQDQSYGDVRSWHWDFGDGSTSTEQHPIHRYASPGEWVVTLSIKGPEGRDRHSKVWDVVTP
ncbi:PKD domain-containing protein, partial [Pelagicoccus mobilis]